MVNSERNPRTSVPTKRKNDSEHAASDPKASRRASSAGKGGNGSPVRIVERITPDKSPNDPNEYRVIRLSSGLTAVLISRRMPSRGEGQPPSATGTPSSSLSLYPALLLKSEMEEPMLSALKWFQQPTHSFLQPPSIKSGGLMGDLSCNAGVGPGRPMGFTSVALAVNLGGCDDPENCQGLAHFTEHMVHYGSEEYPDEGAVDNLLMNFGYFNAFTSQQSTCYFNAVPDDLLVQDLDMFSEMLSHPMFHLDNLRREVNAVDNEFYLRMPMMNQMLLLPHVAIRNKGHPLTRFLCGNLETLTNCTGENGKRVQGIMKENFKKKYVASAMTLSINSTKSLEELEDFTLTHFSKLLQGPHQVLHKLSKKTASEPLTVQNTNKHVYLQGDTSLGLLILAWVLPPALWTENGHEKVTDIMSELLSDTSENGLDAYLRREGLIWSMSAGPNNTHYATIFGFIMLLTEAGQANVGRIIDATFTFINNIRDKTPEPEMQRFFEEVKIRNLREFHYGFQYRSVDDTVNSAMELQSNAALKNVIIAGSWSDAKFNYKRIIGALELLKPCSMLTLETIPKQQTLEQIKKRENCSAQVQNVPFTKVPFLMVPKPSCKNQPKTQDLFRLPPASQFLEEEYQKNCSRRDSKNYFLLRPENCGDIGRQILRWKSASDATLIPKIIGIHWGHQEVSYDPYMAMVSLTFLCPLFFSGSFNLGCACLWAVVINNKMNSKSSDYLLGGYQCYALPGMVQIAGYPKYITQVVESVLTEMFDSGITENDVLLAKATLRVIREALMSDMLGYVSGTLAGSVSQSQSQHSIDVLEDVEDIVLDDLNNVILAFRKSSMCIVQLRGNIPVAKFEDVAKSLDKREFGPLMDINPAALSSIYKRPQPGVNLPGETCVRVKSLVSPSYTTTVTNVYVVGMQVMGSKESEYFHLAMDFIMSSAFNHLRTQEQLGYSVGGRSNSGSISPVMMFTVHVTGTAKKYTACELNDKIDHFLAEYGNAFKAMDCDLFNMMKERNGVPEAITKEQVGDWFNSLFGRKASITNQCMKWVLNGIRKVSIQVLSGNTAAETKPCNCPKCSNICGWRPRGGGRNPCLEFAEGQGEYKNYFV